MCRGSAKTGVLFTVLPFRSFMARVTHFIPSQVPGNYGIAPVIGHEAWGHEPHVVCRLQFLCADGQLQGMRFSIYGMMGIVSLMTQICGAAEPTPELPTGVEVRQYTGWGDCLYLNASERAVQVVIVPVVGGRVAHFSLDGQNILFENSASQGKTLAGTIGLPWVGGYQCDIGPQTREIPEHSQLLLAPHRWVSTKPFTARTISESELGIHIEKEFVLAADSGDLGINQRMVNDSKEEKSFCLWDRTACKNGGFVLFPLKKKSSRYSNGWAVCREEDGKKRFDAMNPNVPQVHVFDGLLVAETMGGMTRVGADSDAGWMAYVKGDLLFVKYFPHDPAATYGDNGNTVEFYFDQQILEFGPLSPEQKLQPGAQFSLPEKWVLVQLKKEVTTVEEARKLVHKIKPSPFR
jgi:hypothetical protein